jgi:starch phosphorylase
MYLPALDRESDLSANNYARAKEIAVWKRQLRENWQGLKILDVHVDNHKTLKVGDSVTVHAQVDLGHLKPEDVSVELFYGVLNAQGEIESPKVALMKPLEKPNGSVYEFAAVNKLLMSGRLGHTVRVLPHHEDLDNPLKMGLVLWAK